MLCFLLLTIDNVPFLPDKSVSRRYSLTTNFYTAMKLLSYKYHMWKTENWGYKQTMALLTLNEVLEWNALCIPTKSTGFLIHGLILVSMLVQEIAAVHYSQIKRKTRLRVS